MRRAYLFSLLALPALVLAEQIPLLFNEDESSSYQFQWPIHKVAVIGAGPGGLITYNELNQAGFEVHLIERDTSPGGNWHYTDEIPVVTHIPSGDIAVGDYEPSLPPNGVSLPYVEEYEDEEVGKRVRTAHRAPKPIWKSLRSNAPAPIQQIRELPWPKGTPWELPHKRLQQYLRAYAFYHGINSNDDNNKVFYNTRVELAEQHYNEQEKRDGWTLTLKHVTRGSDGITRATWRKEHYDAIVAATGRYNAPNVPRIEGLKEWAERFPDHVTHSRQYRSSEPFVNKSVLVVGAATSGGEISREINPLVKTVYQSIRPDKATVPHFDLKTFLRRLPTNTTIVPEIKRFLPVSPASSFNEGRIELVNGTILTGVDHIIFGTGYRYTYPFLPQFINSSLGTNGTLPRSRSQPIVTDGTHVRSLYLDTFYIQDPTLAFINVNFGMQSFTYAEFLGLAIAKVWSGKANIPQTPGLWAAYDSAVKERQGYGRHFQYLGPERTRNILRFFQGWLNDAAVRYGGRQIDGLPYELNEIQSIWMAARFGKNAFAVVNSLGNVNFTDESTIESSYGSAYDDYW